MGLSRERGHERRHEQSRVIFFFVQGRGKHFVQRGDVLTCA